jgi:hypothetical protein
MPMLEIIKDIGRFVSVTQELRRGNFKSSTLTTEE